MPVTPGGRWSPADTDDWDLTVDLAAMQLSNESASASEIASIKQNYRIGTEAQRTALTGADLYEGLRFRTTDTNRDYLYDGANWASADAGMYLLRPTSVTGGTVQADGSILPTAGAASLNIDFSSLAAYRTVKMEFALYPTTGASPLLRFRRGGTTLVAAASYGNQRQWANGGVPGSDFSSIDSIHLGVSAQVFSTGTATFFNPGITSAQKMWQAQSFQGTTNPHVANFGGYKGDAEISAPIDGFTLLWTPANTFTNDTRNLIKFYGLA